MCWLVHAAVAHHCTTLLLYLCNIHHSVKRLCRKHGISKWPYRQLLSIDGQLERLEVDLQKAVSKPSPQSSDELQNVTELQDRMSAMRVDRAALVASESLGETKDQQQQQQQQQQPVLVCAVKRPSRANATAAVVTADSSSDSECESKATPKKKHYRVMRPLKRPLERLLAPAATVSTISPHSAACAYSDVDRAQQQQQHQQYQHHHHVAMQPLGTAPAAAAATSFEAALHGVWDSDMLKSFDAGAWPEFFKSLPVPVSTAHQQQSVAVPLQQQQQQYSLTMHHFHNHMPVLPTPYSSLSNTNNYNDGSASSSSSSSNTYNNVPAAASAASVAIEGYTYGIDDALSTAGSAFNFADALLW
jgi:hypothetical protein